MNNKCKKKRATAAKAGSSAPHIRRILVVIGALNVDDATAISRGAEIARRFCADLHLVHLLLSSEEATTNDKRSTAACAQILLSNPTVLREVVARWITTESSVEVEPEDMYIVHISQSEMSPASVAAMMESLAARIGAELVVFSASACQCREDTAATSLSLMSSFGNRAVLLAARSDDDVDDCHRRQKGPRAGGDVVVATDLQDPRYPLVEAGFRYASATGRRLTLVHNMGAAPATRSASEDDWLMTRRLRTIERVTERFPGVRIVNLARSPSTAKAIDEVAALSDADLVVIGVRPGRGHTLVHYLESRRIPRSVLAIPLPLTTNEELTDVDGCELDDGAAESSKATPKESGASPTKEDAE